MDNQDPTSIIGYCFNNISILYSPNIFQIENKPYVILKIKDAQNLKQREKYKQKFGHYPPPGKMGQLIVPLANDKQDEVLRKYLGFQQ